MKAVPQYLGVQELADSAVVLRFVVEVSEKDIFSAKRMLNRDLWLGFRKLGVECPFQQLDIGKLNYWPSDIDWKKFGSEVETLCQILGLDYYIKDDLRKEMEKP